MKQYTVAMLVGSLRFESINKKLAKSIVNISPPNLKYKRVGMDLMPWYNGDLETNRPSEVREFVAEIRAADAVCIVTPEYNRSIPALVKNAIDWGSKPADENIWRDKVIAMTGASPGGIGTAVGQQHLRQILSIQGAYVLPGECYISFKRPDMIDEAGLVDEESVRIFLTKFCSRFAKFVDLVHSGIDAGPLAR